MASGGRPDRRRGCRFAVLGALAVLALLAGCIGTSEEQEISTQLASQQEEQANPWQAGLDDEYPTPAFVEQRSAEERRSDVAPPGDPNFAAFDAKIEAWMEKHDIPTGQLALMQDGHLLYERGYGHADREASQPANASTMFRIASVTKPMTAALVSLQVEQGLYNWTDPVFCLPAQAPPSECRLPIEPHPNQPVVDERLQDVEVRHLLDHQGGWSRSTDWIWWGSGPLGVAETLEVDPPPSAWRTAQFLMGEEMDHDPGGTNPDGYCNICYVLSGLVAEAATGASLEALYDAYLFEPLDVDADIEAGRTLPEERNPREPFYPCEGGEAVSVFDPNETVCWVDGGWSLQTILGAGGLVSTAEAVAAVYEAYTENVPGGELGPWTWRGHSGGLPGTATMALVVEDETFSGEVHGVALFNSREAGDHCGFLGPVVGCSVYDLQLALLPTLTAWGSAQHATPTSATSS